MSDWDYGIYFFQSSLLSCFSVTNTYCSYDKDCFQVIKKLTKRPLPVGHHSSVKNKKEKEMLLFYIQCLQITSFLTKWFFFFFWNTVNDSSTRKKFCPVHVTIFKLAICADLVSLSVCILTRRSVDMMHS